MQGNSTGQVRSRVMARVKGRDTGPELYVRSQVWRQGFRFRLHVRRLPGKPDLTLPRYKLVVFVHGCFWHQHGCARSRRPVSNQEYWDRKLDGNIARDAKNARLLRAMGWTVATVWECRLEQDTSTVLDLLKEMRSNQSLDRSTSN